MAKLSIDNVVDHLEDEFRRALQLTIKEHFPDQEFKPRSVFKTFKEQLYKKCNDWEDIPNKYIKSK